MSFQKVHKLVGKSLEVVDDLVSWQNALRTFKNQRSAKKVATTKLHLNEEKERKENEEVAINNKIKADFELEKHALETERENAKAEAQNHDLKMATSLNTSILAAAAAAGLDTQSFKDAVLKSVLESITTSKN
jgi:hypothetical protein